MDNNQIDSLTFQLIADMERQRKLDKIEPTNVLFLELQSRIIDELKQSINRLSKDKKIEFGKTLNDIYLKTK